jgi:hypothetical protein
MSLKIKRCEIEALVRRYSARLPARPRTPETIVGYGADGLPQ